MTRWSWTNGGQPRRLVSPLQHRRPEVDVVDVQQPAVAEVEIGALAGARLARAPRQVVLAVVHDRKAAEDDVAEEMLAQLPHRRHHPAHAERRADLLGLAGARRPRADHLLQRDDVGVDVAQHLGDPRRDDAAVHAAAAVDVVGRDPQIDLPTAAADRSSRRSLLPLQDPDERPEIFSHTGRAAIRAA